MTLQTPFIIGPRLLPALHVGRAFLSMEFIGVRCGRCVYRWTIDLPGGEEHAADDIESPRDDLQAAFGSLLAFLGACAEGRSYATSTGRESENADLFPDAVGEWAQEFSNEIDSLRYEIEESGAQLISND